eukprot:NODE_2798_length_468_cov_247.274463_g2208_i0.p1 GENE.NODE_2798_length_468_cov_247.274463_g2208_i0~~NODE_2798_length_468_cov_247.274463_g2208_i0.p1  ORF type:complete len:131 (-),score=43.19 NODE_2798_length_468_cov_247.274463_g2208_i0:74-415(-)
MNNKAATPTSWASPNEHYLQFDKFTEVYAWDLKSFFGLQARKQSEFLRVTRTPWWSPLYVLLTQRKLRKASNELCANYNWTKKGDDFGVQNPMIPEPFGRELRLHKESEATAH